MIRAVLDDVSTIETEHSAASSADPLGDTVSNGRSAIENQDARR
jgi:hypothetical protein